MKKLIAASLVAGTTLTFAVSARAVDFPATPINHGAPTNLPGETLIPGLTEAMTVVNTVTQPILQPILAPMPAPVAEPAPPMRRRFVRHSSKRRFAMKKKMMKKMS